MRKVALVLAGLVAGATISWGVVAAQDGGTPIATLCTRAGTDVRSPATNGTCPSGYTKVVIPAADSVFERDLGQSLNIATRTFIPAGGARTGATVQLVAVAPDGTITLGTAFSAATPGTVVDVINISDPQQGTWHLGVQWAGGNTTFGPDERPATAVEVTSSRGPQKTLLLAAPMHQQPSVGGAQMLADFAYFVPVPPTTTTLAS